MKIVLLATATAMAVASPAAAQSWLQTYQVDQALNNMFLDATRANQAAVNRGLNMINPQPQPQSIYNCPPMSRAMGLC